MTMHDDLTKIELELKRTLTTFKQLANMQTEAYAVNVSLNSLYYRVSAKSLILDLN